MNSTIATRCQREGRQFESGLVLHLSPRIFSCIRDVRGFSVVRSACPILDLSGLSAQLRPRAFCTWGVAVATLRNCIAIPMEGGVSLQPAEDADKLWYAYFLL